MISRLFLASGAIIAAASDAGALETIKNVFLIVFLAVGAVWLLLEARRNLTLSYGDADTSAPARAATPTAASPVSVPSRIPAEIVAVITAAVHASLGSTAQIVAIAGTDDSRTWAAEGRRAIYATRKVR